MKEITAGELSKILKEHERWYDTGKDEGEKANLSDVNLTQVKNLSINKISKIKTLYKAKLDPELIEQVKDKYPHLLKKPKSEE